MPDVWTISPASALVRENLDDYLVCYSRESGATLLLDAFPAAILNLLDPGARTTSQLQRELALVMGEADFRKQLEGALRQLEAGGLIQRVRGEAG